MKQTECAICLIPVGEEHSSGPVHINKDPVLGLQLLEDPSKPNTVTELKTCFVTPCKHFFHESCLSRWMEIKLECPSCKSVLPPLD